METSKAKKVLHFHDTTGLQPDELQSEEQKAKSQAQIILELFRKHPEMSASDVYRKYPHSDLFGPPITSIRRAISNLKKAGYLEITGKLKTGIYGKKEHIYKYKG